MTRSIQATLYLFGGISFLLIGAATFVGPVLFRVGSGTTPGISAWVVLGPWGAFLLGGGTYWLLRFYKVRPSSPARPKT